MGADHRRKGNGMKRAVVVVLMIPLVGCAPAAPVTERRLPPPPRRLGSRRHAVTRRQSPTVSKPTSRPPSRPRPGRTAPRPAGTDFIRTGISSPTRAREARSRSSKTNKLAQRIEAERSDAKGKRLYYLLIDLDNTKGSEQVRLDTIEFVDQDGHRIQSLEEQDVIERWHLPSGYAARRRLIKLQTDMAISLAPGEEGTAVKVFNRRISSISRAFVYLEDGLAVVEALRRAS